MLTQCNMSVVCQSEPSIALPLPFPGGCSSFKLRLGELDIAADENDGRRRPPFCDAGERYTGGVELCVGVGGRELFCLELGDRGDTGAEPSPEAASVSRNSTHRRENDCTNGIISSTLGGQGRGERHADAPRSRLSSRVLALCPCLLRVPTSRSRLMREGRYLCVGDLLFRARRRSTGGWTPTGKASRTVSSLRGESGGTKAVRW